MTTQPSPSETTQLEWLQGWDDTPGIVSVWPDASGRVRVWRRENGALLQEDEVFRPWVLSRRSDPMDHIEKKFLPDLEVVALPGPGVFKHRISATNWRVLKRALARHAPDLRDHSDYLCVGLTEQYLMQTGRTCFRGLRYQDLHRLQFDLETTGLEAATSKIFLIAVRDSLGFETLLEGKERDIIAALVRVVRERDPDVIENHNLMGFDLPFLFARAQTLGVPLAMGRGLHDRFHDGFHDESHGGLGLLRQEGKRHSLPGRELIDTLDAVWRHDFVTRELPSHGLKTVAQHYGLAAPDRVYLEGKDIARTYRDQPELVRRYALEDVREVDRLSQHLLPASFALTQFAPRRFERVASAGTATGILEPMLLRAYLHAGRAWPQSQDAHNPTPHEGGAVQLYRTGLVRNVVKADVASLYPSIIRAFGFGPKCDELGVFVALVRHMLALRLHHKSQARKNQAHKDQAQHAHHDAMQAALKLVINSAYGYLGAGSMARFADREAADAITAKGREILRDVVTQLGNAGMALLEADTDGVYFALPHNTTQNDARALVESISATLPQGITLEFDDFYPAMLSHDIKNYALLTQDGRGILRGVNFRSVRFEPAFARFVQTTAQAMLHNQPEIMQETFRDLHRKISARQLPSDDLAMQVRLRKSPEDYQHSRGRMREAPYEAMLEAGRVWRKGARIRFYRRQGGGFCVLSEDANPAHDPRDYDLGHYTAVLRRVYAKKFEHAFTSEDFALCFSLGLQEPLFATPLSLQWLRP